MYIFFNLTASHDSEQKQSEHPLIPAPHYSVREGIQIQRADSAPVKLNIRYKLRESQKKVYTKIKPVSSAATNKAGVATPSVLSKLLGSSLRPIGWTAEIKKGAAADCNAGEEMEKAQTPLSLTGLAFPRHSGESLFLAVVSWGTRQAAVQTLSHGLRVVVSTGTGELGSMPRTCVCVCVLVREREKERDSFWFIGCIMTLE